MIKTVFLIIPGILALALSSGKVSAQSGTTVSNHRESRESLVGMRGSNGSLTTLTLGKSAHVTTGDGRVLQAADIRLGDHLSVKNGTQVQDISQHVESMRGIVSVAPTDKNDSVVLQVKPTLSIVVDAGSHTRYTDRSHETSSVTQLEDADILQIRGVYDAALGEMIVTDQIARLGPFHDKKKAKKKA